MIAAMQHDYRISELCEAFGVSRSGYYGHQRKPAGQRRREDEALRPKIAAAYHESRQTYGTPRLRVALGEKEGTGISLERIARLMRELGLQPLQTGRFTPRTTQSDPAAAAWARAASYGTPASKRRNSRLTVLFARPSSLPMAAGPFPCLCSSSTCALSAPVRCP